MKGPTPFQILSLSLVESVLCFYLIPHAFLNSTLTTIFLIFSAVNWNIYAFYHLVIYPFFLTPFRHLPQPNSGFYPLLGHLGSTFSRPPGAAQVKLMKEVPNDGIIFAKGVFHSDRLILTTPAALADVLVHKSYDFEKPPWVRAFLRQFLGDGLLMTEGDEHKHQRKNIMPAFHFRHIKELYPVFWSKALELCRTLKRELADQQDPVLEMNHFSTQVTLDIIGLAGLGRDVASLKNSDDELIKNYEEILEPSPEKGIYFILHLIFPIWMIKALPWRLNNRVKVTTSNLKRICTEFVQEKKSRMKRESEEQVDILSIMIRSNNFSDNGLVDQLLTFLAAGHETTSSALTWATYLLATHPDKQTRLRKEIHTNIPDPKVLSQPGFDIATLLESLPYLNAVCNETLRLFPTIPISARIATRDTSILQQFVPEGTLIFVIPWAINRNPHLWGMDAESFNPGRWLDPESGRANYMGGADSNYSFLTFLHGPRSCIGERFARAELRALVAAFVGSFEVEMEREGQKITPGGTITSKPIEGMRVRLQAVEW